MQKDFYFIFDWLNQSHLQRSEVWHIAADVQSTDIMHLTVDKLNYV